MDVAAVKMEERRSTIDFLFGAQWTTTKITNVTERSGPLCDGTDLQNHVNESVSFVAVPPAYHTDGSAPLGTEPFNSQTGVGLGPLL